MGQMAGETLSWTNLGPGHDNKQAGLPPTYGQGALQVPGARMTGLVTKMFWGKDESLEGRGELVVVRAPLACVRGGQGKEGLGRTPEGTPPVMGTEQLKGLLEEETSELRWEREERARCAKSRWTDSTKDLGSVWRDLRVQDTRLGGDTVEAREAEQERQGTCR